MKKICAIFVIMIFLNGCAYHTRMTSNPTGAEVYRQKKNKQKLLGTTPFYFDDISGAKRKYLFVVKKPGYQPLEIRYMQNSVNAGCVVGSVVGGLLIIIPFIGLIWMYQLPEEINFDLVPVDLALTPTPTTPIPAPIPQAQAPAPSTSKHGPVMSQQATVFSGPGGVNDGMIGTIQEGTPIKILKKENGWYKFSSDTYTDGNSWVHSAFVYTIPSSCSPSDTSTSHDERGQ